MEERVKKVNLRAVCRLAGMGMVLAFTLNAAGQAISADERTELLRVRESVWMAWLVNDQAKLAKLVPPDTIVISTGEKKFKDQAAVLKEAADFYGQGGKLIRLEFPRTEMQRFGDVVMMYSEYTLELEVGGKRSLTNGRVTEIFVKRNGQWVNPGWHTDSES